MEGPAWEYSWSLKRWGLVETGVERRFTCVGRSVVAADICGLVRVGRHNFIVVLVRAVDTHLGSPARLAARELPGPSLIPHPPHPVQVPFGSQRRLPKFSNGSSGTSKAPGERPCLPTRSMVFVL